MTIAVSGGAGFIGSRLVAALAATGHDVVSIDIAEDHEERVRLARSRHDAIGQGDVEIRHADVTDLLDVGQAIGGCDVLVHLAGPVVETVRKQPYQSLELQVRGTLNAFEAARQHSLEKVVLASSFYVYSGVPADHVVNEVTPLDPLAMEPFGTVKMMAERIAKQYGDAYGLRWSALRFGSAYGFGRCSNVVQTIIEFGMRNEPFQVWGKGERRNQYTFVEDIVAGIALAIEKGDGEVFNLISPEVTTTGELAATFRAEHGFEVMFDTDRADPPSMAYMASQKAERMLGWHARPLSEGIARTVKEAKEV